MKIIKKAHGMSDRADLSIETPGWSVYYRENACVFRAENNKTVVLEGDVYYCLNGDSKPLRLLSGGDACGLLQRAYDSAGEDGFADTVEGIYNVAFIDAEHDTVTVIGDAFNRLNLFYSLDEKYPVISTEFEDVISCFDTIDYDPAVTCCLLILGYPPLKHTPYRGLFRLGIGERLLLQNGKVNLVKAGVKPVTAREMDESDLDRYGEILENSVLSRASQSENWVGLSSGWDSSTVLGILRKYFDKPSVRPVISAIKLRDGRYFNPYEIERAQEIARYYDVDTEIAMIDFGDENLHKLWSDTLRTVHSQFLYEYTFLYQAMMDVILSKKKPDASVMVGSYSDGLHNFGFSQFISLPYLSNDFRKYGDKMRSYLYSPSFLKKVEDNTFEDDFAYKLFKCCHGDVAFTDVSSMSRNERIFEYLLSFIVSISRLPFAAIATEPAFSGYARANLREWLYENYFRDAVEQINVENMYFWLTRLYQHFHLQGFEKKAQDAGLEGAGRRCCMPFYDLQMVKFLEAMPEDWGRGLEWRPAKYPQKHYAQKNIRIPQDVIESGNHSYITESEEGRNVDIRAEVINNSILTANTIKDARDSADLEKTFGNDWFNMDILKDMLVQGRGESGSALPLRVLLFASKK